MAAPTSAADDADDQRQGGQFQRGGEDAEQIVQHWVSGHDRGAEFAVHHFDQIVPVLLQQRLIQPELEPHPFVGFVAGFVADNGQHRIDRDDPTDHEGDAGQAQKGQPDRNQ